MTMKKITFYVAALLLAIISGCGKDSSNTSGYKLDPKVYTLPTEQEAAEFFEFFAKAINAGDYGKIDETIDPGAMYFFNPELTGKIKEAGGNESKIIELSKTEYGKQLRTIKSVSQEPEYMLKKDGCIGFSVDGTLQNGKKLQVPATIFLYKNGKGKIGICMVHIFG